MRIDADAEREAYEPPSITIGGHTYVGRILSAEQFKPFWGHIQRWNTMKPEEKLALTHLYLRAVFPWRPSFLIKGDPVTRIRQLPGAMMSEVIDRFFQYQARCMTPRTTVPNPDVLHLVLDMAPQAVG